MIDRDTERRIEILQEFAAFSTPLPDPYKDVNLFAEMMDVPFGVEGGRRDRGSLGFNDMRYLSSSKAGKLGGGHNKKLTNEQVIDIRARSNEPKKSLAREFGVSPKTIRNVLLCETYANV